MNINKAGLGIVKEFEGWRPNVYRDAVGVPTIGYGSTWDTIGDRVTMEHKSITRDEGVRLLQREINHVENAIGILIKVPLTENEFSALCSFTYNLGSGNLQSSTLRMKLNRWDYTGAANEFWKWRRAAGRILPGLVRRRAVEEALFIKQVYALWRTI